MLKKVKRQLNTASNTIDETGVRTRAMEKKLRDVEQLPGDASKNLLGLTEEIPPESVDDDEDDVE